MNICGYNIESPVHVGRICDNLAAPAPRGRYAGVSAQRCSCTATAETILPVVRAGLSDVIVCSTVTQFMLVSAHCLKRT